MTVQPEPRSPDGDLLLRTEHVSLSFGNVRALVDVSITLRRGEITALVGDNGAGKSTLVRCISGIHTTARSPWAGATTWCRSCAAWRRRPSSTA
ncbi:ATP-binding cassette domain-containing protein [Nonomuraea sp. NPDC050536]|uniref:ATP-binding cassette domain-containing protein n=1 Tax=Nonomuraea sp. NPDC050536 TaxID=3364366 RepID=UPI0037C75155